MNNKHKAFYLSLALVCFEAVRNKEQPKTARFTKLDNAMDNCMKATELYNANGFAFEDSKKAGDLIDEIDTRIKEIYPEEHTDGTD